MRGRRQDLPTSHRLSFKALLARPLRLPALGQANGDGLLAVLHLWARLRARAKAAGLVLVHDLLHLGLLAALGLRLHSHGLLHGCSYSPYLTLNEPSAPSGMPGSQAGSCFISSRQTSRCLSWCPSRGISMATSSCDMVQIL